MATDVGGVVGGLFGGLLDISAMVVVGILGLLILVGVMYYFMGYRRKFDITVKILSERATDERVFFTKAAILTDKKGNKFFKILKPSVELSVPPFKVMESTNKGDYLEIWRKSEDEFVFLVQPKIDKEKVIRADGKIYPVARTEQKHLEGDAYWISKRKEENKRLLDPESVFMKLLAWSPQIISSVFLLIILWIFMDKLPELVSTLVRLTKELQQLKGGVVPA